MRIYIEHLPEEYRRKLTARKLSLETIDSLARQISRRYRAQKRLLQRTAVFCLAVTVLMPLLTAFHPSMSKGSLPILLLCSALVLILELLIFITLHYAAVARVPRQFSRALEKGYPELAMIYGYEAVISKALADAGSPRQLPFSLLVEDLFPLSNGEDLVVVGFVHGLISRNVSVYIIDKDDPSKGRRAAMVTGIETAGHPVSEAADCHAALRIRNGKHLNLTKGMYLYRETGR